MANIQSNPDPLMAEAEPHAERTLSKTEHGNEKVRSVNSSSQNDDGFDSDGKDWHDGVLRVRAITSAWSKKTMWSMFALLWLVSFIDILQNALDFALNPYVTSSFFAHGLMNVSGVMSSAVGACTPLALAKVLDLWGRVEGFLFALLICVIGMILKATTQSVEQYVGAHVLYWTGHIALMYVISVIISDMTSLKNRALVFAVNGLPRIASTFLGPIIAQRFYEDSNYRWAFGAFAIILTGFSIPAMSVMVFMYRKADKAGLVPKREPSGRTWYQSIIHYAIEIDVVGIILLCGAVILTTIPFSLVSFAPNGWQTPYIGGMIATGVLLYPIFWFYEFRVAPKQFLEYRYLKNGTILGSCFLYGAMFLSSFTWNAYLYSYIQVVYLLDITYSNYVVNSYSLTSTVFAPLIALIIAYTGNFKWTAYAGVPIMLLGTALILPMRTADNAGLIAMTQVLVGLGAGFFATCTSVSIMVPVTHEEFAVVHALSDLFGGFGASIGGAISGAIWNNVAPGELLRRLPEESKDQAAAIFGSVVTQMSLPIGSPERDAIVGTYQHTMRLMTIAGIATMPLCFVCIFVWKNVNIRQLEKEKGLQTKGNVF
ncbi:major facilitator superfamily protein [Sarocladium implicatum]|nr:major facilitator superfamily protein [Sarocladium implicatum]